MIKKGKFGIAVIKHYRAIMKRAERYDNILKAEQVKRNYRKCAMEVMLKIIQLIAVRDEAKEIAEAVSGALQKVDTDDLLKNRFLHNMRVSDLACGRGHKYIKRVYRQIEKQLQLFERELSANGINWRKFSVCESSIAVDIRRRLGVPLDKH
ncbi:MAG: hypothetical protein FWB72_02535 [Firmicutes bacterium]|nr:hypothetical protein [Bacillota bacterium]